MLRWLKRAFTQNLLLKFTALVCAVVVWVYVDSFVSDELALPAKVRVVAPVARTNIYWTWPDGTPFWERDAQVVVTVRGPKRCLRLLGPEDVQATVGTPSASGIGEHTIVLHARDFVLPGGAGILVTGFDPGELTVRNNVAQPGMQSQPTKVEP